jgi:hypothetical protein
MASKPLPVCAARVKNAAAHEGITARPSRTSKEFGNTSLPTIPTQLIVCAKKSRALLSLTTSPHQGHWRRDLTSRPLRFQLVRDYLIAYAPDETPLIVVDVLHGRRSPPVMAAILRGSDKAT